MEFFNKITISLKGMSNKKKAIIALALLLSIVSIVLSIVYLSSGDSRGSCVGFDCSSSDNDLNANPAGITCAGDPCLATECCTVVPTVAPSCIRPTDTSITDVYNFTQAQETSLYMDNSFEVTGITCNSGYGPGDNIVASVCNSANTAYTLTGCSDIDGCYNQASGGTVDCGNNAVCEDNNAPNTGYTCVCESGYSGSDSINGPATCTLEYCATGRGIPAIFGPAFGGTDQLQAMTGAENNPCENTPIRGECVLPPYLNCPAGKIGGSILCQEDGRWAVENCTPVVCDSEPVTTNQNMTIIAEERLSSGAGDALGRCRGADPDDTCAHQCNSGFTGGSVTCVRDGDNADWIVEACTAEPAEEGGAGGEQVPTVLSDTAAFTWVSGSTGANCDATCEAHAVGSTCVGDGDWGIHDASSFREVRVAAGQRRACDTQSSLATQIPGLPPLESYPATSDFHTELHCHISAQGIQSSCSSQGDDYERFCPCTV